MLKRILAIAGVAVLVALYICTFVFAIIGNGYFMNMFMASLGATVAVPAMIHLFLMMNNVRNGRKLYDNPYTYRNDNKTDEMTEK